VTRASLAGLVVALAAFPGAAFADTVYTVDNGSPPFLGKFDTATPENLTVIGPVTGLLGIPGPDILTAIDFRPSDGRLYAISNQNRIYTIDTATAAATIVGDTAFTPAISTSTVDADFDPVRDVLRMVTDGVGGGPKNLRISPTTGQATVDTPPNKAGAASDPCFCGLAYTNNFPGASSTTAFGFGICGGSALYLIGSENGDPFPADSGRLTLVEETNPYQNVNQGLRVGLDIAPNGDAYALIQNPGNRVFLYRVDLREGTQTLYDPLILGAQPRDASTEWRDIAIAPAANDFAFSAPPYSVGEAAGRITVTVTRAGPALGTASVAYTTGDGSATSPSDYTPVAGTLDFGAGQRSASFTVPIADDAIFEGSETINLVLSAPHGGAASVLEPSTVPLTIGDDELAPPVPGGPGGSGIDTTAPTLALTRQRARSLSAFLKGVRVKATPGEPAALEFELIAKRKGAARAATRDVVLAAVTLPLAGGARTVTLKPRRRLVGRPRKAYTVRLRVTATDAAANRKVVTKAFAVKPNKSQTP
jgi:hypothetical protein